MDAKTARTILLSTILLALLIAIVSFFGLFVTNFYNKETPNWQLQTVGQDVVDLFIVVPVLIITVLFFVRKNLIAGFLWAGTLTYILYTFLIYCYNIHFNQFFLIYCFILGLSFYLLAWFIYTQVRDPFIVDTKNRAVVRATGIFFIVVAVMFYVLWLSDIVPAMFDDTVPKGLADTGLVTNPVHVIDLSVLLPAIFIIGIKVLRNKPLGFLFAIIILAFFVLMNTTIAWLAFKLYQEGFDPNPSVIAIMSVLTLLSIALLTWNIKYILIKKP